MAVSEDFLSYVQEQLSGVEPFETKKMFGGIGFFKDGIMFGMIGGGVLRFRVDDETIRRYEDEGMEPFKPNPAKKGMPYWQVPVTVLEDRDAIKEWALEAIETSVRNKK